jgi:hypothetical protein
MHIATIKQTFEVLMIETEVLKLDVDDEQVEEFLIPNEKEKDTGK